MSKSPSFTSNKIPQKILRELKYCPERVCVCECMDKAFSCFLPTDSINFPQNKKKTFSFPSFLKEFPFSLCGWLLIVNVHRNFQSLKFFWSFHSTCCKQLCEWNGKFLFYCSTKKFVFKNEKMSKSTCGLKYKIYSRVL